MDPEDIKNIIREFLEKLTVNVEDIIITRSDIHPIFQIKTGDSGALIGSGGENLRALNYLLKKVVEKKLGEETSRFILDVNGYHERRIGEIRKQAQILAERAKSFRHNIEMSPMNSYERMIVHSFFAENPFIKTESEGEGKFRRVVIKYIDEAESGADIGLGDPFGV